MKPGGLNRVETVIYHSEDTAGGVFCQEDSAKIWRARAQEREMRLIEPVSDIIAHCVTVTACSRSGIHQNDSAFGALNERSVTLADLNGVQDQLGLRLVPGCRD